VLQVFASLYTLSKNRKATDIRWTAGRVVLEFLQVGEKKTATTAAAASPKQQHSAPDASTALTTS
jgi:hypothetical protein